MKREWTNAIRSILDNYVPRRWRNASWFMRPLFFLAYRGRNIHSAMHFKTLVKTWTPDELTAYYQQLNSISRNRKTDNSQKTIEKILAIALASKGPILDAGCGTGYLLSLISDQNKTASLYGCILLPSVTSTKPLRLNNATWRPYPIRTNSSTWLLVRTPLNISSLWRKPSAN